jgi:anti-anti-sigma factor
MTLAGIAHPTRTSARLVVSMSIDGDATVVAFQGDADLTSLPFLVDVIAAVIADRDGTVVLDLAGTEFIDTACVRAIGLAAQSLADGGRDMTFRSPSRFVAMLLATFGLTHLVEADGDMEH